MNLSTKLLVVLAIFQFPTSFISTLHAQSLSPQVVASSGGYQSNSAGSLSFTIGETQTQTLVSVTHKLTQGFQQTFELNVLHVKAFLEGYYMGSGQMQDVLYNQGEYANPSIVTDSVIVELHEATTPYNVAFQTKGVIQQNGNIQIQGMGMIGQPYYIVLKHRNSVETWSSNPITLSTNTIYDFTTAASQAFGANQNEVESGVWAVYSGDMNQDMAIDAFDYLSLEPDITNGNSGYLSTDLSGDGVVDAFDYLILDGNIFNGIGAVTP